MPDTKNVESSKNWPEHLILSYSIPPAYSPNLNLIERLWKFVKIKCLYCKYCAGFSDFKHVIIACLGQTHTTYKSELDTLLTPRFQAFEKAQFIAA